MPARRGFTLVELLVAAALGLLVASAVSVLLVSQLRAFARTQGATAVQRDLRLGLALLPMDLRGASRSDTDFVALTATSAELRATIASSVVCNVGSSGPTTLALPPVDLPKVTLTAAFATPQPGDTVKVLIRPTAGGDKDQWLTGAVDGGSSTIPWSEWPSSTTPGPTGLCAGAGVAGTGVPPRLALPVIWPSTVTAAQLALVVPGMPVRILRRVRYELYDAGNGRWFLGYSERTRNVWSTREPVAGPYAATPASGAGSGVSFAYFDTTGVTSIPAPVSVADLTRIGRIDVTLRPRTQVRAGAGKDSVVARDSALVRVALRNRI